MKKRILALALACVMALTLLPFGVLPARAAEETDRYVPAGAEDGDVSAEEKTALRDGLEEFGYLDGDCTYTLLFNTENEAQYILGVSGGGYMILERKGLSFMEAGEGENPYEAYPGCRWFYNGVFGYYVKLKKGNDQYQSVRRDAETRLGAGLHNLPKVETEIVMMVLGGVQAGAEVSGYSVH